MKAIDTIETARSYYLLSNDRETKPFLVGGRIKLEFALKDVEAEDVIATFGNNSRCIILIDRNSDDTLMLSQKGNEGVRRLKAKN